MVLTYGGEQFNSPVDPKLVQYVDADNRFNYHRKSSSGYVSTIAGGAVAWSSKKQSTVVLSTAEAEYVSAFHATTIQTLWCGYLFNKPGISQPEKSNLWPDNQAAIAISHSPEFHMQTKHIDISLHFICDYVKARQLKIKYVLSCESLADIFTKALA